MGALREIFSKPIDVYDADGKLIFHADGLLEDDSVNEGIPEPDIGHMAPDENCPPYEPLWTEEEMVEDERKRAAAKTE